MGNANRHACPKTPPSCFCIYNGIDENECDIDFIYYSDYSSYSNFLNACDEHVRRLKLDPKNTFINVAPAIVKQHGFIVVITLL